MEENREPLTEILLSIIAVFVLTPLLQVLLAQQLGVQPLVVAELLQPGVLPPNLLQDCTLILLLK